MNEATKRGPFGDARPDADRDLDVNPSLPQEDIDDRENVGTVKPEDYPAIERDSAGIKAGKKMGKPLKKRQAG